MAKGRGGFPGMGMGGGNFQAAIMKAQKMQQQVMAKQAELEKEELEANAGGGMVNVKVNGKKEILSISIKPEAVDPDDIEMLEDMVMAAVNEALRMVDEMTKREMGKITGGMNRPPFEFTKEGQGLFAKAAEAAAEYGIDLKGITVGGGSDANFTSGWGIPSLDGLGPVGDGAHAAKEHLMIRESLAHTAMLTNLLTKL